MLRRLRSRLTYANVVSTLALFLVLSGGATALAAVIISSNSQVASSTISGHKPPTGDHANIISGSVNGTDLASGAVTGTKLAGGAVTGTKLAAGAVGNGALAANSVDGTKVLDGSLTGADIASNSITGSQINVPTLGEVTLAKMGGYGRWTGAQSCNPGANVIDCAITTINLPVAAKVLLIGQATAYAETDNPFNADCILVTNSGNLDATRQDYSGLGDNDSDSGGMVGITGVLAAGSHDFAADCYDFGNTAFEDVGITAVAISPD